MKTIAAILALIATTAGAGYVVTNPAAGDVYTHELARDYMAAIRERYAVANVPWDDIVQSFSGSVASVTLTNEAIFGAGLFVPRNVLTNLDARLIAITSSFVPTYYGAGLSNYVHRGATAPSDLPMLSSAGVLDALGIGWATNLTTNAWGHITGGAGGFGRLQSTVYTSDWVLAEMYGTTNGWAGRASLRDFGLQYWDGNAWIWGVNASGDSNAVCTITIQGSAINRGAQTTYTTQEVFAVGVSTPQQTDSAWYSVTNISAIGSAPTGVVAIAIGYQQPIMLYGEWPYVPSATAFSERYEYLDELRWTKASEAYFTNSTYRQAFWESSNCVDFLSGLETNWDGAAWLLPGDQAPSAAATYTSGGGYYGGSTTRRRSTPVAEITQYSNITATVDFYGRFDGDLDDAGEIDALDTLGSGDIIWVRDDGAHDGSTGVVVITFGVIGDIDTWPGVYASSCPEPGSSWGWTLGVTEGQRVAVARWALDYVMEE